MNISKIKSAVNKLVLCAGKGYKLFEEILGGWLPVHLGQCFILFRFYNLILLSKLKLLLLRLYRYTLTTFHCVHYVRISVEKSQNSTILKDFFIIILHTTTNSICRYILQPIVVLEKGLI